MDAKLEPQKVKLNTYSVDGRRSIIGMWTTPNEFQDIHARAKASGVSASRYVLSSAFGGIYDPPITPEDAPVLTADLAAMETTLKTLGTDMNDVARQANTDGVPPESAVAVTLRVKETATTVLGLLNNVMSRAEDAAIEVADTPLEARKVGARATSPRTKAATRSKRIDVLATAEQTQLLTLKAHNHGVSRSRLLLEAALSNPQSRLMPALSTGLAAEVWVTRTQLSGCGINLRQTLKHTEPGTRLHTILIEADQVTYQATSKLYELHRGLHQ